jgi:SAM-dependent methyltransferase
MAGLPRLSVGGGAPAAAAPPAASSGDAQDSSGGLLSAFLDKLTPEQKTYSAIGAIAAVMAGGLLLLRASSSRGVPAQLEEPDDLPEDAASSSTRAASHSSEASSASSSASPSARPDHGVEGLSPSADPAARVKILKDKGNMHFKNREYEDAIRAYTDALALDPDSAHVLFSNRAAAFTAVQDFANALKDAESAIDLKPDWAKGYFRKGKALLGLNDIDSAFIAFFQGTSVDPSSDELKRMLATAQKELGIGELDTRGRVETKLIEKHLEELARNLCVEKLGGIDVNEFATAVKATTNDEDVWNLPIVKQAIGESPADAYRLVAQTMLFEMPDRMRGAQMAVQRALDADPENAGAQLIAAHHVLRDEADIKRALEHIRVSLRGEPKGVMVAHSFASILVRINPMDTTPFLEGQELFAVLEELIPAVTNPLANRLLVADAGLRLWFRLFDSPEIKAQFEDEEKRFAGRPEREALIQGLETGSYSKLVREPFFLHVLADVVLVNSMLERLLIPFRIAVTTQKKGKYSKELAPFCHALALQCFKSNYSWLISEDEELIVSHFANKLRRTIGDEEQRKTLLDPETKELTPIFKRWLNVLSLYRNIDTIPTQRGALASVLREADLSKEHPWFREMLQKSVLDREIERELFSKVKSVTPDTRCSEELQNFYDARIHPFWDLIQPSVTKRTVAEEMRWLFPHHTFTGFDGSDAERLDRVLVAGCGSGLDTEQFHSQYSQTDVVALDISRPNLAFAMRQCTEGIAEFVHGDILALEPEHLEADSKPFDLCVAQNVLHHLENLVPGWQRLVGCLRTGGLFSGAVYNRNYIRMLKTARTWLNGKFKEPVFDNNPDLPQVIRQPSDVELRQVRHQLLEDIQVLQMPWMQRGAVDATPPEELMSLINMPAFYNLEQFRDLVFHPSVCGFDFKTLGKVLEEVGLRLVSFEFPSLPQDVVLRYRAEHPDDPHMLNFEYLDDWDEKHDLIPLMLSPHYLFLAEKI